MGFTLKKRPKGLRFASLNPLWAGEYTQTEGEFYFPVSYCRSSDSLLSLGPQVTIKWAIAFYGLISLDVFCFLL
jgi:hypothetical protein